MRHKETKGWLCEVADRVRTFGSKTFYLEDVYVFEDELGELYPNNNHIKDKIRQQLHFLCQSGSIRMIQNGVYTCSK